MTTRQAHTPAHNPLANPEPITIFFGLDFNHNVAEITVILVQGCMRTTLTSDLVRIRAHAQKPNA